MFGIGRIRDWSRKVCGSLNICRTVYLEKHYWQPTCTPATSFRAEREPWLVIDPKPFAGDPAYDATQHLFNCQERLRSDPDGTIRRFAELLGVDHERVRLWTFARAAAEPRDDWSNAGWVTLAR